MNKTHSQNWGTGREEKSIPVIRERESEDLIAGNGQEREFPLTPDTVQIFYKCKLQFDSENIFKVFFKYKFLFIGCSDIPFSLKRRG